MKPFQHEKSKVYHVPLKYIRTGSIGPFYRSLCDDNYSVEETKTPDKSATICKQCAKTLKRLTGYVFISATVKDGELK